MADFFKSESFPIDMKTESIVSELLAPNRLPTKLDVDRALSCTSMVEIRNRWRMLFQDKKIPTFELLTVEYVDALADYLSHRIDFFQQKKSKPITIVELGAGNGRLMHFLHERIKVEHNSTQMRATDSGKWGLTSFFPVEKLDIKESLAKYSPDIVIVSWMPSGVDFTSEIRNCRNVQEYILIGKPDEGTSGDEWLTWGKVGFKQGSDAGLSLLSHDYATEMEKLQQLSIPPYEVDGFERIELPEISKYQICGDDSPDHYAPGYSKTTSFRRN